MEYAGRLNELRTNSLVEDTRVNGSNRVDEVSVSAVLGPPLFRFAGRVGFGNRESLALGASSDSRLGGLGYTYRRSVTPYPLSLSYLDFGVEEDLKTTTETHVLDYQIEGLLLLLGLGMSEAEQKTRTYRLRSKGEAYWARLSLENELVDLELLASIANLSIRLRSGETQYGKLDRLGGMYGYAAASVPIIAGLRLSGSLDVLSAELSRPNHFWTVPFSPVGGWYYYRLRNIEGEVFGYITGVGLTYTWDTVIGGSRIEAGVGAEFLPFRLRSETALEMAVMYPLEFPHYEDQETVLVDLGGSLAKLQVRLNANYGAATLSAGINQWLPLVVKENPSSWRDGKDSDDTPGDGDAGGGGTGVLSALWPENRADLLWAGTQLTFSLLVAW